MRVEKANTPFHFKDIYHLESTHMTMCPSSAIVAIRLKGLELLGGRSERFDGFEIEAFQAGVNLVDAAGGLRLNELASDSLQRTTIQNIVTDLGGEKLLTISPRASTRSNSFFKCSLLLIGMGLLRPNA